LVIKWIYTRKSTLFHIPEVEEVIKTEIKKYILGGVKNILISVLTL